jgi:hypothetical protein
MPEYILGIWLDFEIDKILMMRFLLFCVYFLNSFLGSTQVIENFESDWIVKREGFLLNKNTQYDLFLPVSTYPESFFFFQIPEKHTVFLEGKLWKSISRDTSFALPVSVLMKEYGTDSVLISILGKELHGDIQAVRITKGFNLESSISVKPEESGLPNSLKFSSNSLKDFCFTSVLVILFFLAAYRMAYPYLLGELLRPLALINAEDFTENGGLQKVFSFDILFFLFIAGLLIGQIFVIGLLIFKKELIEMWIGWDFSSFLMLWIGFSFLFFFLISLKFLVIRIFGYLFEMGKSDFAHFFYLLRLTVFGFSLISLVSLFLAVNDFKMLEPAFRILIYGIFWVYLLGIVGLFLSMMNRLNFKKYHLFTYLCIVEIVPFLILSKGIMVLGQ